MLASARSTLQCCPLCELRGLSGWCVVFPARVVCGLPLSITSTNTLQQVTVIKANPDQSKHLETATCCIGGLELDFVNLRTEHYDDASDRRIPHQVFCGTAEEDAYRRDITINSLFYNVTTSKVEDLTGCGVRDLLVDRLIRTPLDPRVTFMDDPLRVLRAVRFAAVLEGFELVPELCAAAKSAAVSYTHLTLPTIYSV